MADTVDFEFDVGMNTESAEKSAEHLQKEIEKIFEAHRGTESATLSTLETQMRNNCDRAIQLQKDMNALSQEIANTQSYANFQKKIENTEASLESLSKAIEQAKEVTTRKTNAPLAMRNVKDIDAEIELTRKAIAQSEERGLSTDAYVKKIELLSGYQEKYNAQLENTRVAYRGQIVSFQELQEMYDNAQKSIESLRASQAELSNGDSQMTFANASSQLDNLQQKYNSLDTILNITTSSIERQAVAYSETAQRQQEAQEAEEQRLAEIQRLAEEQARIEAAMQQMADERRQDMEAQAELEKQLAQKRWEMAVEEQERQAALQQQHQQEKANMQAIKDAAEEAKIAQREARMETIAANSSLMALNMTVRSIGRLIPGLSTTALSAIVMMSRAMMRVTRITSTDLMNALTKVGAGIVKIFDFIMSHPLVLVVGALIAAIVLLIKKLKEMYDETKKQVEEIFKLVEDGLKRLMELFKEFTVALAKGFVKVGLTIPKLFAKGAEKLVELLKYIANIGLNNLDTLAKWNDGNNTLNKSLSNITSSLEYLKAAIASVIAPVITYVEPVLTRIIDLLAQVFTAIGMLIAKLTGANTFQKAIRVQKDYAESLKQTNGQLASFDKLNVLNSNNANAGVDFKLIDLKEEELPDWLKELTDDFGGFMNKLGKKISKFIKKFLKSINWNTLKTKAREIGGGFAEFINGLFEVPDIGTTIGNTLGEAFNTITSLINGFINDLKADEIGSQLGDALMGFVYTTDWVEVGNIFSGAMNKLAEMVKNFTDEVNGEDIGRAISIVIKNALDGLDWEMIGEAIDGIAEDLAGLLNKVLTPDNFTLVGDTLANALNTVFHGIQVFTDTAKWTEWGQAIATGIMEFFEKVDWKATALTISHLVTGFLDMILSALKYLTDPVNLKTIMKSVKDFFENIPWKEIGERAKQISTQLRGVLALIWKTLKESGAYDEIISMIRDFLEEKENWEKLFSAFKAEFVGDLLWAKIKGIFQTVANAVASALNKIIEFVKNALGAIADIIGDVKVALGITETSYSASSNMDRHVLKAPQFANGAVLPPNKPFLAVVGDQKNGTNVEAPLSTIQQAVADVMKDIQVNVKFDVQGDPNKLFKAVQKEARIYYNQTERTAF